MLRLVIVLLLLAANALMFAWQQGVLGGPSPAQQDREPDRLKRQINPELAKVLSPVAASAALAEAARANSATAATPEDTASTPASGVAPAASAPQPAAAAKPVATTVSTLAETHCLEAGPFATSELPAAIKALRSAAIPADSWTTVSSLRKGSYLVYMGRYADANVLARKQAELQRRKVEFKLLSDWPDLQPGLVLGRFEDKPSADAALAKLAQRGVRTSRVVTLSPSVTLATLRVPSATAEQVALLSALKLPPGRLGFGPCPHDSRKA